VLKAWVAMVISLCISGIIQQAGCVMCTSVVWSLVFVCASVPQTCLPQTRPKCSIRSLVYVSSKVMAVMTLLPFQLASGPCIQHMNICGLYDTR